jgi:LAS superfamily LD-carboxypeptidase LdcB
MMDKLLVFGITCMILGAAMNIFLLITSNAAGQQQTKQPSIANQPQQGEQQSPNQRQQQQQLLQQLINKPPLNQQKQQQQLLNQNQHQGQSVYTANQVIACLNHQLTSSIVKAGITGALALHNNTNGTVTASLNQTFITNATKVLDSCIIPRK